MSTKAARETRQAHLAAVAMDTDRRHRRRSAAAWAAGLAVVVAVIAAMLLTSRPESSETVRAAPDFTLKTQDGEGELTLSRLVGPKPVVLVFGNFTCGPFRNQAGNVEKLYRMYKDRATFVMVYVREAHPTDGWRMESNDRAEVALDQPRHVVAAQDPGHRPWRLGLLAVAVMWLVVASFGPLSYAFANTVLWLFAGIAETTSKQARKDEPAVGAPA